jgi:hypothetical protein
MGDTEMMTITAQKAAAMEMLGHGTFQVHGRTIVFTGNDGRKAIWQASSQSMAEVQLRSWRRVFSQEVGA